MVRNFLCAALASVSILSLPTAHAAYPDRPVRLIVPFPPGGSIDAVARLIAEKLRVPLGQPVVVENRSGATGNIGTQAVAKSDPDGYTLLMHTSAIVINPWLTKAAFDAQRDFIPITRTATTPYAFVVRSTLPIKTLEDFVKYAKQHPGKLTCSTYGIGSPPHIALELLKQAAKVDVVHLPYRGFTQALPDLASGQLDCAMDSPTNVQPHVRSGMLHAVGVTAKTPYPLFPSAAAIAHTYPGTEVEGWQGILAPAGTPKATIDRLNSEIVKIVRGSEVQAKLRDLGFTPVGDTPVEFSTIFKEDYERFGRIIQSQGIRPE